MRQIKTIPDLISKLSINDTSEYAKILSALDLSHNYFDTYSSWSKEKYTRTCLYNDERYELILLCWEVGVKTPIHCHGGEECWVRVVKGELKEVFYENSIKNFNETAIKCHYLKADGLSYISDFIGLHSLENRSNQRSLSLHLYAKPIKTCRYYDVSKKEMLSTTLKYDKDVSSDFNFTS